MVSSTKRTFCKTQVKKLIHQINCKNGQCDRTQLFFSFGIIEINFQKLKTKFKVRVFTCFPLGLRTYN